MAIVVPAIPASEIVRVIPGVIEAGGTAAELLGLMVTDNEAAPIGQVLEFATADDLSDYFGSGTQEDALGSIYFLGFDNSLAKPSSLVVVRYPRTAASAFLRGFSVASLSLSELQALSGALSVTINGTVKSGSVNLSGVTSFSNAATQIANELNIPSGTQIASVTGSISGTTLTVSAVTSGVLSVGAMLSGTDVDAGTYITALGTGTGGAGTYTVTPSQTGASQGITARAPGVEYDPNQDTFVVRSNLTGTGSTITFASGVLAVGLKLTEDAGAILSQGAAAASPIPFMDDVIDSARNWFTFFTTWKATDDEAEDFANWTNQQGNIFAYALSDYDPEDVQAGGPGEAWAAIREAEYSGIVGYYEDPDIDVSGQQMAAFTASYPSSLDFTQNQGRTTFAFRRQSGLPAQVKNASRAQFLESYGLNYYGRFTTDNDAFTVTYNGAVTGPFLWFDSYTNQAWFNRALQLAALNFMVQVRSIPYNQEGYAMIEAALLDPILNAVNFGAIQPGITLSEAQKAQINSAAGIRIDDVLRRRGWYLQVKDASPQVRQARGSPPCTLWYTDGQSVQRINLSSFSVL